MGIITAPIKVSNIKDEKKSLEDVFLVDSGAQYTVLPEKDWKKLKLKPDRKQKFSLADGRVVERKIGSAMIEYKNRKAPSTVVLGKKNDSRLLGALTLESLGLTLEPFQRKIYESKLMLGSFTSTPLPKKK